MKKIYNLNNGRVEIFQLGQDDYETAKFVLDELGTMPIEERLLKKDNPSNWFTPKKGIVYECGAYILRKSNPKEVQKTRFLLNDYIFGGLEFERLTARNDIHGNDLYLLEPSYPFNNVNIQLTKDLYLQTLIENEEYASSILQESNLDRIKRLFSISDKPIDTIDIEEMAKVYDLVEEKPEAYRKKMSAIEDSTKVFQKLR